MASIFPALHSGSMLVRFIRVVSMFALILVVGWAFWLNNERTVQKFKYKQSIVDETETLDQDEINYLRDFAKSLKDEFGMKAMVQVRKEELKVPELDSKTLYVGLLPRDRVVVVEFPSLMSRALGQEFLDYLRKEHFAPYWESGNWPRGLQTALTMIWSRLAAPEPGSIQGAGQ